jgi:hypothetical protein
MRLTVEATAGERVAFYRRRKGITQEVLAGCWDAVSNGLPSSSAASKSWTGCPPSSPSPTHWASSR